MSVCQQAKAARRKANLDPRYSWKRKDINVRSVRARRAWIAEQERKQRKAGKK